MAPPGRRPAAPKRKKADAFFHEDDDAVDFFDGGVEDEAQAQEEESEQSSGEEETAEEKRLRLAKEYLTRVRAVEVSARARDKADDEEEEEEEAESDADSIDAAMSRRLRQDAAEARGAGHRRLAGRVVAPGGWAERAYATLPGTKLHRGHALSVTSLALTADDRTLYSVGKDGRVLRHDVETGKRERLASHAESGTSGPEGTAPWLAPSARLTSRDALLACAVSSDGVYVAAGGGSRKVVVWDARAGGAPIRAFKGHKDAVTALAFRQGSHELYSGSLDRSVKIWSLDDMAYVDTLFGHQAEVLALDALRTERVVSAGGDRTCRVWKIPEESQLIFRGTYPVIESCAFSRGGEWVSGDASGALALWNVGRKKPVHVVPGAHAATLDQQAADVLSVAVCPASDLVASGAGDGLVRLWALEQGRHGAGARALRPVGGLPVRGFVNGLAIARSTRFVAAALGQEPRLGRWARQGAARNGVAFLPLELNAGDAHDEEGSDSEGADSSDEEL